MASIVTTIGELHDAHAGGEINVVKWYTDKIEVLEELCEVAHGKKKQDFLTALESLKNLCLWHREIYPGDFE